MGVIPSQFGKYILKKIKFYFNKYLDQTPIHILVLVPLSYLILFLLISFDDRYPFELRLLGKFLLVISFTAIIDVVYRLKISLIKQQHKFHPLYYLYMQFIEKPMEQYWYFIGAMYDNETQSILKPNRFNAAYFETVYRRFFSDVKIPGTNYYDYIRDLLIGVNIILSRIKPTDDAELYDLLLRFQKSNSPRSITETLTDADRILKEGSTIVDVGHTKHQYLKRVMGRVNADVDLLWSLRTKFLFYSPVNK